MFTCVAIATSQKCSLLDKVIVQTLPTRLETVISHPIMSITDTTIRLRLFHVHIIKPPPTISARLVQYTATASTCCHYHHHDCSFSLWRGMRKQTTAQTRQASLRPCRPSFQGTSSPTNSHRLRFYAAGEKVGGRI